jgi:hypothetical protein
VILNITSTDALIDSDALFLLKPEDLRSIFYDVPRGVVVKFEKAFTDWKKLNATSIATQFGEASSEQNFLSVNAIEVRNHLQCHSN